VTRDPGTEKRRAVRARVAEYHFGLVLALLAITFVFMASGPSGNWVRVVTVVLQGATLLAALVAAEAKPRLVRLAAIVVVVGFVVSLASLFVDSSRTGDGVFFVISALLVGASPVVIARSIIKRGVVDFRTVLAAICIYVLIGMLAAFIFSAMGYIGSSPFFAQQKHASIDIYLYYSFATITTVGYGDFTAAGGLGRAFSVLEALVGQLYLVTVVALLVSNLRRPRDRAGA
jgi:drug/metabolite transporter (DMT)-like permease